MITANGSNAAVLSNNILHDKHAVKELLLENEFPVYAVLILDEFNNYARCFDGENFV